MVADDKQTIATLQDLGVSLEDDEHGPSEGLVFREVDDKPGGVAIDVIEDKTIIATIDAEYDGIVQLVKGLSAWLASPDESTPRLESRVAAVAHALGDIRKRIGELSKRIDTLDERGTAHEVVQTIAGDTKSVRTKRLRFGELQQAVFACESPVTVEVSSPGAAVLRQVGFDTPNDFAAREVAFVLGERIRTVVLRKGGRGFVFLVRGRKAEL